ncbi:MAG: S41 family peptidase [Kiritimatiellae bacterium]|nr:S41 family peptidase [Kiritimatiellia bacterium]
MFWRSTIACATALFVFNLMAAEAAQDYTRIYLGSRPTVAPDGKQFIFEWCDSLWIAATKGGEAKPLELTPSKDQWPIFAPDGKKVAFQSNRNGGWKIFEYHLETKQNRQLTFHSESSTPCCWNKAGDSLIASVTRDDAGLIRYNRLAWISTVERRAEQKLFDTEAGEPSLSPDQSQLLFTREGENIYRKGVNNTKASQIWLYNLKSNEFKPVVKRLTESRTPLWTPDGKGFYYVSGEGGVMNIRHHDLKTGEERPLTFFKDDSVIHPALSLDGSTMVFRHLFDFYTINPKKSAPTPVKIILHPSQSPLRPKDRRRYYNSCWNNDADGCVSFCDFGMQIAFTTGGDLFVMDTNIKEPVTVHSDSLTHERECAFTPDGKKLLYISDHGSGTALWQAECANTNQFWWENTQFTKKVLLNDSTNRSNLTISPDGTKFAWVEPVGHLVIADNSGAELNRVTAQSGVGKYDWAPDSKYLVAAMSDAYSNSDIWIIAADNAVPPYNISRHFNWDGDPCWSKDGKLIAYVGWRENKTPRLFYLWLNPNDEYFATTGKKRAEAQNAIREMTGQKKAEADKSNSTAIDFDEIHNRVRTVEIKEASSLSTPFFSQKTSTTLAFAATIKGDSGTYKISIPDNLTPGKMTDRIGVAPQWLEKNDLLLWVHNKLPAKFNTTIALNVYQDTDISEYQELGFLTGWGRLRDWFYDPNYHGADWEAVKEKYRLAARNAPSYSVFSRVMHLLNGELRASHLGFSSSDSSKKEWDIELKQHAWQEQTFHPGLIFDPDHKGEGWLVKEVVLEGPAHRSDYAFAPGDLILAVNGTPVSPMSDPTEVFNGHARSTLSLEVFSNTNKVESVKLQPESFQDIRAKRNTEKFNQLRKHVHDASNQKFGYLHIARMQWDEYYKFEQEIFAEGYNKEAMIIDVRDNTGGFTADYVLNILCGANHSIAVMRDGDPAYLSGYWGRPVWHKPIIVLCNQNTASNGEIFTHAIKTLQRGRIVGVPSSGAVIATSDKPLLDLGKLRLPHRGWFLMDGTDMEEQGAEPDVILWNTPEDEIKGYDRQLEEAIKLLEEDVELYKQSNPPVQLRFYNPLRKSKPLLAK